LAYWHRIDARSFGVLAAVGALVLVAGCMTAPEFPRRVSVTEVIENARCELYDAVKENEGRYPWIKDWAAGFDLSFVVDRDANASTDTSYVVPINLGTFAIGLRASSRNKAKSTFAVKFKITGGLGNYAQINCPRIANFPRVLLNGELGLRRWLNDVIPQVENARISKTAGTKGSGDIESLTYTMEFGVTMDGSLLPSWSLTYPDKSQFRPGFNLTAAEANTHKMIVAMTPRARPETLDWSTILAKRTDKTGKEVTVIVGRRVCQMGPNEEKDCPSEPQPGQMAKQAAKKLEASEKALEKIEDDRDRKQDQVTRSLREALPNIEVPEMRSVKNKSQVFDTLKKESTRRGMPAATRTIEDAKRQYDEIERQAQKDLARAQESVRRARREVEEARRNNPEAVAAQRAAEAEAERETARRLDFMIQQQVIRDAFRQ
jgi:hypothetical protein